MLIIVDNNVYFRYGSDARWQPVPDVHLHAEEIAASILFNSQMTPSRDQEFFDPIYDIRMSLAPIKDSWASCQIPRTVMIHASFSLPILYTESQLLTLTVCSSIAVPPESF